MRFEHTNRYPASAQAVLAMLTSRAFRERVCQHQRALEHDVEITGTGPGSTVLITQSQSMERAPSAARRLTGDRVTIVQRESWGSANAAAFSMEIPGKPGHLRGTAQLRDDGHGSCEEVVTGEVKVDIPLVGRKLERLIGDLLRQALVREGEVGVAWLQEQRG